MTQPTDQEGNMEDSYEVEGELFEIRARGLLARMFQTRHVNPEPEHWEMLRGLRDITARDIGSIAFQLGFEVEFGSSALTPVDFDEKGRDA